MSHWNNRVVHRKINGEDYYAIHEAHYDEGETYPHSITQDSIAPYGETLTELVETLDRMKQCLDAPILEYDNFWKD